MALSEVPVRVLGCDFLLVEKTAFLSFSLIVNGCTNRNGQKLGLPFHRIPAEKERRTKKMATIKREHFVPTKHTSLCGKHFISSCFLLIQL